MKQKRNKKIVYHALRVAILNATKFSKRIIRDEAKPLVA